MEIWQDVAGYKGRYKVSNLGRVKGFYYNGDGDLLKTKVKRGHEVVIFTVDKKKIDKTVARLVAEAFLPPTDKFERVVHKDGNLLNNEASNLEWANATRR